MKTAVFTFTFLLTFSAANAQVLLEDKEGQVIVRNQFKEDDNLSLIKLNTGDQSLGFNYIRSTRLLRPSSYRISEFGVKAKPTEGFAAVFSNGQFSPGIKFSYALTKVKIFSEDKGLTKAGFFDWAGFEINYETNKYALYKPDTTFNSQFYSKTFRPLSLSLFYHYLVTRGELNSRLLISLKTGYTRRSNFDELKVVELQDLVASTDPAGTITRQSINKRTAKTGNYQEFDAYPMTLSLTFLTRTDPTTIPNPAYRITPRTTTIKIADTVFTNCTTTMNERDSVIKVKDTAIRNGNMVITIRDQTIKVRDTLRTNCSQTITIRDSSITVNDTTKAEKEIPNPNVKRLRLGLNVYLKNVVSNSDLPSTKLGLIFFLTNQNEKTGIRNPVFGINIQADDPFDVRKSNNGLQSRLSLGFTSIFSL